MARDSLCSSVYWRSLLRRHTVQVKERISWAHLYWECQKCPFHILSHDLIMHPTHQYTFQSHLQERSTQDRIQTPKLTSKNLRTSLIMSGAMSCPFCKNHKTIGTKSSDIYMPGTMFSFLFFILCFHDGCHFPCSVGANQFAPTAVKMPRALECVFSVPRMCIFGSSSGIFFCLSGNKPDNPCGNVCMHMSVFACMYVCMYVYTYV